MLRKTSLVGSGYLKIIPIYIYACLYNPYMSLMDPFQTEKVKTQPYPSSMTKVSTLRYFSLWNQAVSLLLSDWFGVRKG